jgi:two-component system, LuxR family, response regulator FixJ
MTVPESVVYVVDDDDAVRDSLQALLDSAGFVVETFETGEIFLDTDELSNIGCVISDIRMPGMDGLQLHAALKSRGVALPVLFITGHGDVPLAVNAMRAGAIDFIEKPFDEEMLLASVRRAIALSRDAQSLEEHTAELRRRTQELTPREREVMIGLAQGKQNKVIAIELGISPRTVEIHRARVMEKMAATSLPDLVRAALSLGLV